MRNILISNKIGLSEMIGYVILVTVALSLSVAVFAWIKYVIPKESAECDNDVSLVINEYSCAGNLITLDMSNRGLHEIEGFYVRVRSSESGLPTEKVKYGGVSTNEIYIHAAADSEFAVNLEYLNSINLIEIEPFQIKDEKIVACKESVIKQELNSC